MLLFSQNPSYCIEKYTYSEKGAKCINSCDLDCGHGHHECPGQMTADGCRWDPYCIPDGECCPEDKLDNRGCPIVERTPECDTLLWYFTDLHCSGNSTYCSGYYDCNGCEMPPFCAPNHCPQPEYDNRGCYVHPYPNCNYTTEETCWRGQDEKVFYTSSLTWHKFLF